MVPKRLNAFAVALDDYEWSGKNRQASSGPDPVNVRIPGILPGLMNGREIVVVQAWFARSLSFGRMFQCTR
jgi:hypothetical protein